VTKNFDIDIVGELDSSARAEMQKDAEDIIAARKEAKLRQEFPDEYATTGYVDVAAQGLTFISSSAVPALPQAGMAYYDNNTGNIHIFDGKDWQTLASTP
jgi:hypothetical protein